MNTSSNINELRDDTDHSYFIGLRVFELYIHGCQSLKEKRFAIKSLKDRLKNKFNISVSEIGFQDLLQRSAVAITAISGDKKRVLAILNKTNEFVENDQRTVVTDTFTQII